MTVEGVDYAFPPRPSIPGLAAAGKVFACRYGGPGTLDKQLDPQEARELTAAGIAIVANAEGAANGLTGGWSAGVSWATKAEAHFAACGMPPDRPIYFSVDFDVVRDAWPQVADGLRGAASVVGLDRVGVYGGRDAIVWARRDDVARWLWQTYAWSGGIWVPGNHIEQYRNGVTVAGADVDLNRALQPDYGQWTVKGGKKKMRQMVCRADGDKVYLSDMMTRRWIKDEAEAANVVWWAQQGYADPIKDMHLGFPACVNFVGDAIGAFGVDITGSSSTPGDPSGCENILPTLAAATEAAAAVLRG